MCFSWCSGSSAFCKGEVIPSNICRYAHQNKLKDPQSSMIPNAHWSSKLIMSCPHSNPVGRCLAPFRTKAVVIQVLRFREAEPSWLTKVFESCGRTNMHRTAYDSNEAVRTYESYNSNGITRQIVRPGLEHSTLRNSKRDGPKSSIVNNLLGDMLRASNLQCLHPLAILHLSVSLSLSLYLSLSVCALDMRWRWRVWSCVSACCARSSVFPIRLSHCRHAFRDIPKAQCTSKIPIGSRNSAIRNACHTSLRPS